MGTLSREKDRPDPEDLAIIGKTEAEFLAELAAADEATANDPTPDAIGARYDRASGRVVVDLSSDTTFIFPARMAQGLTTATDDQLAEIALSPAGWLLRWPQLDVDLSVGSLLNGIFGSKAWMSRQQAERGRKGGAVTSEAKAKSSRENGKKGGRPKKSKQA